MLTPEQLEARKLGIGGSDVGAILGICNYRTPLDVYKDKLGLSEPEDLSANDRVHFGNVLEDIVAQEYARREGVSVRRRNQHFAHKQYPFMLANIDRSVDGMRRIVECKTTDKFYAMTDHWGDTGTDQVPETYLLQVAHYMAVLNYDDAHLACLVGGNEYRRFDIERDSELEEMMIEAEKEFWFDNVLAQVPPAPIRMSDIESAFRKDNGKAITVTADIMAKLGELKSVRATLKGLEETKGSLEVDIKAFIDDSAILEDNEGKALATWKMSKGSVKLDQPSLKIAHPHIFEDFSFDANGSRRFLIK